MIAGERGTRRREHGDVCSRSKCDSRVSNSIYLERHPQREIDTRYLSVLEPAFTAREWEFMWRVRGYEERSSGRSNPFD